MTRLAVIWATALLACIPRAAAQTEHTLDVERRAVEFLSGEPLTQAERDAVTAAGRARHEANPAHDDAEVDRLSASLAPVQGASPANVARGRETMMDLLAYQADQPSRRPFLNIILRHNPILVRDEGEQQVFTGRELDGYLSSFDAVANALGVPRPTDSTRAAMASDLVARFKTLDSEVRERLEDGEYRAIVLRDWLARLTPAQIATCRASVGPAPTQAQLADAVARFSDLAEQAGDRMP